MTEQPSLRRKHDHLEDARRQLSQSGPEQFLSATTALCSNALAFHTRKAEGIFCTRLAALAESNVDPPKVFEFVRIHAELWRTWGQDHIGLGSKALTVLFFNSKVQTYDEIAKMIFDRGVSDEGVHRSSVLDAFDDHIRAVSKGSKTGEGISQRNQRRVLRLRLQLIKMCKSSIGHESDSVESDYSHLVELHFMCATVHRHIGLSETNRRHMESAVLHYRHCEDIARGCLRPCLENADRSRWIASLLKIAQAYAVVETDSGRCGFIGQFDAAVKALSHLRRFKREFRDACTLLAIVRDADASHLAAQVLRFSLLKSEKLLQSYQREDAHLELDKLEQMCQRWSPSGSLVAQIRLNQFLYYSHSNVLRAWWLYSSLWDQYCQDTSASRLLVKWSNDFSQISNLLEFKFQYDRIEPSLNHVRQSVYPLRTKQRRGGDENVKNNLTSDTGAALQTAAATDTPPGTVPCYDDPYVLTIDVSKQDVKSLIDTLIWASANQVNVAGQSLELIAGLRDHIAHNIPSGFYSHFRRFRDRACVDSRTQCLVLQTELALLCFPRLALTPFEMLIGALDGEPDNLLEDLLELYVSICLDLGLANIALKKGLRLVEGYVADCRWDDALRLSDRLLNKIKLTLSSVASIEDRNAILERLHDVYHALLAVRAQLPNGLKHPRLFAELDSAKDWRLILEQERYRPGYREDSSVRGRVLVEAAHRMASELALGPVTFVQLSLLGPNTWACAILKAHGHLASVVFSNVFEGGTDNINRDLETLWLHVKMDHQRDHFSNSDVGPILDRLSRVLLGPIKKHLSLTNFFVSDGFFSRVPFHALSINGKVLGQSTNVSYLPSVQATLNATNFERGCVIDRSALIFGMDQQREAVAEACKVAGEFSNRGIFVRAERRKGRYALEDLSQSQEFGIMYVAGHAEAIDVRTPMRHAFEVGSDLKLTPESILESRCSAHYYVFNGCNTGETATITGDQMGFVYSVFARKALGCLLAKGTLSARTALNMGSAFAETVASGQSTFEAYKRIMQDDPYLTRKLPYFHYGLPARFRESERL